MNASLLKSFSLNGVYFASVCATANTILIITHSKLDEPNMLPFNDYITLVLAIVFLSIYNIKAEPLESKYYTIFYTYTNHIFILLYIRVFVCIFVNPNTYLLNILHLIYYINLYYI